MRNSFILLVLLFLFSCDDWMVPMSPFVKDATSEAYGVAFTIETEHNADIDTKRAGESGKVIAIPAYENDGIDKITRIKVDIINPQSYELELELTGEGADSGKVKIEPASDMQSAILTITNPDRLEHFDLTVTGTFAGREIRQPYKLPKMEGRYFNASLESLSVSIGTLVFTSESYRRTLYTIYNIPSETEYIGITAAVPEGFYSSYTVEGSEPKESGTMTVFASHLDSIRLVVTADSGIAHNNTLMIDRNDPNALTVIHPGAKTYGDTDFTLSTTGGTGNGAVSYEVVTGNEVISLTGDRVSILNAGSASVRAIKAADGTYGQTISAPVTIIIDQRDISLASLTIESGTFVYDKTEKKPGVTVTDIVSGVDLIKTGDYTVSYSGNTRAGSATVHIVPTSAGNYTGALSGNFVIEQKPVNINSGTLTAASRLYNGLQTVNLSGAPAGIETGDNVVFASAQISSANAGSYTINISDITIEGADINNYVFTGSLSVNISKVELTVKAKNESIESSEPPPVYSYEITGFIDGESEATVSIGGSATLTCVYAMGDPAGSYDIIFTVMALTADNYSFNYVNGILSVGLSDQAPLIILSPSGLAYGSTADIGLSGGSTSGAVAFYTVSGAEFISINEAARTVTAVKTGTAVIYAQMAGNGSYKPVTSENFTITVTPRDISALNTDISVDSIGPYTYSGSAYTPVPELTDNGANATITSSDWEITSYSSNTNAGTAAINITGKGNYSGTRTVNFTIDPAEPVITSLPSASKLSAITIGDKLSDLSLSGGLVSFTNSDGSTVTVAGTWTWTDGTINLSVGTHDYSVTFTPTSGNYTSVTGIVSVTARQETDFLITFTQIADGAPNITVPTLYRSVPTTVNVTLSNPTGYQSINWYTTGNSTPLTKGISGTGGSILTLTLDKTHPAYNINYDMVGTHVLSLEVQTTSGAWYIKTVSFTVSN